MSNQLSPASADESDARAVVRNLIDQPDNWPATADKLLARLSQASQPAAFSDQEDEALLSLVVDDAAKGVDISSRYPDFFQRLLEDDDLRQAFLEALEVIENRSAPRLTAAERDLNFLHTPTLRPILEFTSPARWRLRWQAALEQLQQIFFAADQFQPVYRSADFLEDNWFTLFRDEIDIDQLRANVVLEAVRLMTAPDQLQLHIAVGLTPDWTATPQRLPDIRAHLTWGTYDQTVLITQRGRAVFPPLPLNLILDEAAQRITADLRLIVEPAL